jgi:hypothetical protein
MHKIGFKRYKVLRMTVKDLVVLVCMIAVCIHRKQFHTYKAEPADHCLIIQSLIPSL